MVTKTNIYAAVMGDLVESERSRDVEGLHTRFNKAIKTQNNVHRNELASPLTITLGDEFQGLTRSLAGAATLVRDLRLQLTAEGVDCRFVIGRVELKTSLNPDMAWNMMGPGLSQARAKLNEKRSPSRYRFSIPDDPLTETTLEAIGVGLTTVERGWTEQQQHDIMALLGGMTPTELARHRNVSVHNIYKVRGSGDFDAYVIQWHAIGEMLAALDAKGGAS